MMQNSQSLYSFTFTAVIVIHEYIYSHSTSKFTFKKYICLHLTTDFLFTNIFTHIYIIIHIQRLIAVHIHDQISIHYGAIFIQHFLRSPLAHHWVPAPALFWTQMGEEGRPSGVVDQSDPKHKCYTGKIFFLQLSISYKSANWNGTLQK